MSNGENMNVSLLCIFLGVELQGQKVCVCSAFVYSAKQCSKWTLPRTQPASECEHSSCFMSSVVFGIVLAHYNGQRIFMGNDVTYLLLSCLLSCLAI